MGYGGVLKVYTGLHDGGGGGLQVNTFLLQIAGTLYYCGPGILLKELCYNIHVPIHDHMILQIDRSVSHIDGDYISQ